MPRGGVVKNPASNGWPIEICHRSASRIRRSRVLYLFVRSHRRINTAFIDTTAASKDEELPRYNRRMSRRGQRAWPSISRRSEFIPGDERCCPTISPLARYESFTSAADRSRVNVFTTCVRGAGVHRGRSGMSVRARTIELSVLKAAGLLACGPFPRPSISKRCKQTFTTLRQTELAPRPSAPRHASRTRPGTHPINHFTIHRVFLGPATPTGRIYSPRSRPRLSTG